jgi:hypothetical protein
MHACVYSFWAFRVPLIFDQTTKVRKISKIGSTFDYQIWSWRLIVRRVWAYERMLSQDAFRKTVFRTLKSAWNSRNSFVVKTCDSEDRFDSFLIFGSPVCPVKIRNAYQVLSSYTSRSVSFQKIQFVTSKTSTSAHERTKKMIDMKLWKRQKIFTFHALFFYLTFFDFNKMLIVILSASCLVFSLVLKIINWWWEIWSFIVK